MRITRLTLIFILLAPLSHAAIAFVQGGTLYSSSSITLNGVANGNLLVATIGGGSTLASTSVSDGVNSWTALTAQNTGASYSRVFYTINSGTGNRTISITSPPSDCGWSVHEYSGFGASPFEGEAADSISTTVFSSGIVTTTTASALLIGWYVNEAGASANAVTGWTARDSNTSHYDKMLDSIATSTGSFRFSGTQNNNANACATLTVFKEGVGGGPVTDSVTTKIHSPSGIYKVHSPSGTGKVHKP